ncbi:MAG: DUF3429 family protein [Proteobacteria bacterium]|nr:DUF3429 family protein [Pseudomonadota bacterium]
MDLFISCSVSRLDSTHHGLLRRAHTQINPSWRRAQRRNRQAFPRAALVRASSMLWRRLTDLRMNAPNPPSSAAADTVNAPMRMAWTLSLAGLLPLLAALIYAASPATRWMAGAIVFELYAALVLSFLGGMRWGRALALDEDAARLIEAVIPGLLGFAALLLVPVWIPLAVATTGMGFAVWLRRDAGDTAWPPAFRRLRVVISLAVLGLHLALAAVLYLRSPY